MLDFVSHVFQKIITDILTNSHYKLKIAGMTQSLFSESYYVGNFSDETEFSLKGGVFKCYRYLFQGPYS